MAMADDFDVLLFDLGGVLIDFAGFRELGHLLPAGVDRAEVRRRWIRSPMVQRFERAETSPREFACGVIREDLIVRVGADNYTEALLQADVELFDMTGRAMTGWVVVKESGYSEDADLQKWVNQGVEYSLTLPPK